MEVEMAPVAQVTLTDTALKLTTVVGTFEQVGSGSDVTDICERVPMTMFPFGSATKAICVATDGVAAKLTLADADRVRADREADVDDVRREGKPSPSMILTACGWVRSTMTLASFALERASWCAV
jgi:hypothetical protein